MRVVWGPSGAVLWALLSPPATGTAGSAPRGASRLSVAVAGLPTAEGGRHVGPSPDSGKTSRPGG